MEPKGNPHSVGKPHPAGQEKDQTERWQLVQLEELGRLLSEKRRAERLNLEEAAGQVGISVATLWRLEQQRSGNRRDPSKSLPDPDMRTVSAAARWLEVSVERFLDRAAAGPAGSVVHHTGETTPDIVEAHLRADRALDERAAAALARMFRLAYEQVQDLRPAPQQENAQRPSDE